MTSNDLWLPPRTRGIIHPIWQTTHTKLEISHGCPSWNIVFTSKASDTHTFTHNITIACRFLLPLAMNQKGQNPAYHTNTVATRSSRWWLLWHRQSRFDHLKKGIARTLCTIRSITFWTGDKSSDQTKHILMNVINFCGPQSDSWGLPSTVISKCNEPRYCVSRGMSEHSFHQVVYDNWPTTSSFRIFT